MKSSRVGSVLLLIVILGATLFIWRISTGDPGGAWLAFLINLLFFSAIAQAGPVLAAIYHLTEARWGTRVIPMAMGVGSFLPISFLLFAVLLVGFPYLPRYGAEFPARQSWFQPLFLVGREIVGIAILYSVSLLFSHRFLNAMQRNSNDNGLAESRNIPASAKAGGEGRGGNHQAQNLTLLAVLVLGAYAVVFSLIGFDLVMALDHQWYSTLFGGYFFISSFYIGLAAMTVTVVLAMSRSGLQERVQTPALWDLGKLIFAFCLLTVYLLWAQYLVTWYGNLPEEIGFFMRRLQDPAWATLAWTVLALSFVIPFLALLSQRAKQNPLVLGPVAVSALMGMWLERYLLVGPSLDLPNTSALGWSEIGIAMSFLAAMVLSYRAYLQFYRLR